MHSRRREVLGGALLVLGLLISVLGLITTLGEFMDQMDSEDEFDWAYVIGPWSVAVVLVGLGVLTLRDESKRQVW